jgi:hypothetical protein
MPTARSLSLVLKTCCANRTMTLHHCLFASLPIFLHHCLSAGPAQADHTSPPISSARVRNAISEDELKNGESFLVAIRGQFRVFRIHAHTSEYNLGGDDASVRSSGFGSSRSVATGACGPVRWSSYPAASVSSDPRA